MKRAAFAMPALIFFLFSLSALAAGPDAPAGPDADAGAMHTLEGIYNRLDTGAESVKRTGGFSGPAAGPAAGTTHNLNDIYDKAPAPDNTDGLLPSEAPAGKTFWGLNVAGGGWGLQTGTEKKLLVEPDTLMTFYSDIKDFVVVTSMGTPAENGADLLAAYENAKGLSPAENNRVAVILFSGQYDLENSQLVLNADYVDILGVFPGRGQHIFGTANGTNKGVIRQTAADVRLENLTVECTRNSGGLAHNKNDPAAYFPDVGGGNENPAATKIKNCKFMADDSNAWSMRVYVTYAGEFTDCEAGNYSFGGDHGTASGTFTGCTGGDSSFGGYYGTASGTFTNCIGGHYSFGGDHGTASGIFTGCTGAYACFGGSWGTASGNFTGSTGEEYSFGGQDGKASGNFYDCTGGDWSFGGHYGKASGNFADCTGGDYSFGGWSGTASGTFTGCTGEEYSFGGQDGKASGNFYNCTGEDFSFGGYGGFISGVFYCCEGTNGAFGGDHGTGDDTPEFHSCGIDTDDDPGTPADPYDPYGDDPVICPYYLAP